MNVSFQSCSGWSYSCKMFHIVLDYFQNIIVPQHTQCNWFIPIWDHLLWQRICFSILIQCVIFCQTCVSTHSMCSYSLVEQVLFCFYKCGALWVSFLQRQWEKTQISTGLSCEYYYCDILEYLTLLTCNTLSSCTGLFSLLCLWVFSLICGRAAEISLHKAYICCSPYVIGRGGGCVYISAPVRGSF